ncbi:uncharacterized protein LOC123680793 isoform X2 [Harmonia axyridis]|uniref:uncharacterized protein LOC123680793 isoform X2 n=1 Tax=Harmonia axyridis TaxID=115357 RepID=UPI001E276293|nr:uncharacterized protein LOC123680793 isoform X2 [Harmonia axyridis]
MDGNKKYIYTVLTQNSEYYWKFLICYIFLIMLFFWILILSEVLSTVLIMISIVYIISLWIFTVWVTVTFIRKLFLKNQLLDWKIFEEKNIISTHYNTEENTTNQLSKDVVNQFIKIWYDEISIDDKFPTESGLFIKNTLVSINEALNNVDKRQFTYAIFNILLKHLKQFRRSLKLKDKNGQKISELYRYSFSMVTNKKSCEYYIHQMMKKLLINFIHWELWNSIPCKLVISILSNKASYLIDSCSNSEFLNYYILKILLSEEQAFELKLSQYTHIKLNLTHIKGHPKIKILEEEECTYERNLNLTEEEQKAVITTHGDIEKNSSKYPKSEKNCEAMELPVKTKNNVVKVYEPKSTSEKWNETLDLTSVTLGEDPLASPSQRKNLAEAIDILKDEKMDVIAGEGDATANTLRDIKDFQENTVNTVVKPMSQATSQALHKIGDFQDEAAGMVEGLFDLGMAGIRRGLKLTGLQENSSQEGMITEIKARCSLVSPGATNKKVRPPSNAELAEECVWMNPLQTNVDDDVLADNDEVDHVPSILMDSLEYGSPDPEYEEGADFATTIAKLRSLLQQKSSSESISTTPVASPMMSDNNKSLLDLEEVDGFIPSIYKMCAKTATGVFNNTLNTIKTALPSTDEEVIAYGIEKWNFENIEEKGATLSSRMRKLLLERKDFCTIETAYDAFDSQEPETKEFISDVFFDETEDFESKVPLTRTFIDIICELIADSDSFASQEPFIKFLLLVFGKSMDEMIISKVEDLFDNLCVTEVPKSLDCKVLTMDFDVYVEYLISVLPDAVNLLASHSTLKDALNNLILSIQIEKCNKDVILQIFDFMVLRLIENSKNHLQI